MHDIEAIKAAIVLGDTAIPPKGVLLIERGRGELLWIVESIDIIRDNHAVIRAYSSEFGYSTNLIWDKHTRTYKIYGIQSSVIPFEDWPRL